MSKNAVVFCVTRLSLQLTAVAITSIVESYKSAQSLKILVVCEDVQQPDIEYLKTTPRLFGKSQIPIDFWSKPQDVNRISSNFKNNNNIQKSPIAIWRLFTPINFQNYDKLLYLDNDVIVKTDVNNLFNLLDDHHMIAAVKDFIFGAVKEYSEDQYLAEENFGVKSMRRYFNSGLMVINVEQYNRIIPIDKLLEMINKSTWRLADQTIVNILAEGHVKFLPWRYNYQQDLNELQNSKYQWEPDLVQPIIDDYPNILIRHFTGSGFLKAPYDHVQMTDEWDLEFWRLLEKVKRGSLMSSEEN
ncbi:glycosyl transferase [Lacticaseibacillus paracasei]|uniref:glycosyltransferase family 8 protein n=1 Tax=Lacticaseibacillus paracasei TaxID=1597 RepID=UPI000F0B1E6E|nr:glycosyltransferase [Lacticaseibacillus paracasei]MCB5815233.1 glycosyl transferase [Lacticaseibacillus paracasei]RND93768.1 lipopolysaccharide 1,3-galactosyltransferase [Lacticaseibacillus paracasei]RNE14429.1 lipopolysaccharide 1,3-galactosyltransferase [Lacticaseibacillus paracasei]